MKEEAEDQADFLGKKMFGWNADDGLVKDTAADVELAVTERVRALTVLLQVRRCRKRANSG